MYNEFNMSVAQKVLSGKATKEEEKQYHDFIKEKVLSGNGTKEETVWFFSYIEKPQHEEIGQRIQTIWLHDKYPVQNPKAIINIAPPASGKTGLNGYATEQFIDNNVVIINSDELKPFYPMVDVVARLYPQWYTEITNQGSNTWTSDLFDRVLKDGYNVIFEGTGKNARILQTIEKKMQNYEVTVRGMAVNELNCLMSILERYENQVERKGWGRLVVLSHFYETYDNMPNTVDVIEKSGIVNSIEIYKRGDLPHKPIKIYDSKDGEYGRFSSAKHAVLAGRLEDEKKANTYFENCKTSDLLKTSLNNDEVKNIFQKIVELNCDFKNKQNNLGDR